MVSVILRCTILLDSGRFSACLKCSTLARLMAHSHLTSPLSEDTSHPAENDKFSKSVFVLDTYYFFYIFCRLEFQLSLVAMVFAHYETGSSVGRRTEKEQNLSAESLPTL